MKGMRTKYDPPVGIYYVPDNRKHAAQFAVATLGHFGFYCVDQHARLRWKMVRMPANPDCAMLAPKDRLLYTWDGRLIIKVTWPVFKP